MRAGKIQTIIKKLHEFAVTLCIKDKLKQIIINFINCFKQSSQDVILRSFYKVASIALINQLQVPQCPKVLEQQFLCKQCKIFDVEWQTVCNSTLNLLHNVEE